MLVWRGRWASSAALLSLAVCTKPTPLPIALVVLVWLAGRAPREALRYAAVFLAWAAVFVVVPFVALGWRTTQIQQRPNAQFLMTGGLSYTTVARLVRDPLALPGHWWLVGMLWVVALAAGLVLWRRGEGFDDLVRGSAALTLVFLLTRAWLAEPNVVLVLPLVLILASLGELDRRLLTALWLIPLAFAVANLAPLQLLWLTFPDAWRASLTAMGAHRRRAAAAARGAGRGVAGRRLVDGRGLPAPRARRQPASARWRRERRGAPPRRPRAAHRRRAREPPRRRQAPPTPRGGCSGDSCCSTLGTTSREEGVGFGVPVVKRGLQTVFPGSMELTLTAREPDWQVTADLSPGPRRAAGRRATALPCGRGSSTRPRTRSPPCTAACRRCAARSRPPRTRCAGGSAGRRPTSRPGWSRPCR